MFSLRVVSLLAQVAAPIAATCSAPESPFTPLTITLIGGMIVTIIGSIVTGIVAVITALRVTGVKDQQAATTQSLLAVAKDTEAIKGHVNSEKTAAEGRETALRQENALLREMSAERKATAALLAQAAVTTAIAVPAGRALTVPRTPDGRAGDLPTAAESLSQIDAHTAAIEKNTARTDAAVQDLKDQP